MDKIIEINHLNKSFGKIKAVDDLSFCVEEGELFAFLGINSVVLGLILSTGLILLAKSIGYINLSSFQFNLASMIILFIIMTISFILKKIFKKNLNAIFTILICAILGIIVCSLI